MERGGEGTETETVLGRPKEPLQQVSVLGEESVL
jgi:hypothetical protein